MNRFKIEKNSYLKKETIAYYHTDYTGYNSPGNPDYINVLKNTFNNEASENLRHAFNDLTEVLIEDLIQILQIMKLKTLAVCVVPRAKAEENYSKNQLFFKACVKNVAKTTYSCIDGTDYIVRKTDTKTTHLCRAKMPSDFNNDGPMPYPGITKETCIFSNDIYNKDILLIDDIYTKTVNIDEDAVQALLDKGAKSVTFYAVAKTQFKSY
ncbi:MAG: hypothetical protein RBR08_15760 [Desulforegulaceae bacterium]|nr:hypothetical protein [Desulforegulaceae bacterium]